jgi:hypothetical protein
MDERASEYFRRRGINDTALMSAAQPRVENDRLYLPWFDGAGKKIYESWRSLRDEGQRWGDRGAKPSLFASPGAWEADEVALVEGPFDALACAQAGTPAFALAGSDLRDGAAEILASKQRIILVPDNDERGKRAVETWSEQLRGHGEVLRAQVPEGFKDVAEVAQNAKDPIDAVAQVLLRAGLQGLRMLKPSELTACKPEPVRFAIPEFAPRSHVTFLYASPGAGKSTMYWDALVSYAMGRPWLNIYPFPEERQFFVVFDWENREGDVGRNLQRLGLERGRGDETFLFVPSPPGVSLDKPEGLAVVRRVLARYEATAAIFDSRDTAFPNTKEIEGESVVPAMQGVVGLAADLDVAVVIVSHEPKADYHNPVSKLSGHRGWAGQADQAHRLRPRGDTRILDHTKSRALTQRPTLSIRLQAEGLPDIGPMRLLAEKSVTPNRDQRLAEDVAALESWLQGHGGRAPWRKLKEGTRFSDGRLTDAIKASSIVWQPGGKRTDYLLYAEEDLSVP